MGDRKQTSREGDLKPQGERRGFPKAHRALDELGDLPKAHEALDRLYDTLKELDECERGEGAS